MQLQHGSTDDKEERNVVPFTPMHVFPQKEKRNKQYNKHTQLRGDDAATVGTAESKALPTTPDTTKIGLMVTADTTKVSFEKGIPLFCPTQKRNAKMAAKMEATQLQPLIVPKKKKDRNKKKRKSPQTKQWWYCGCGRLHWLNTGLCACTKVEILLKKSFKPQETKERIVRLFGLTTNRRSTTRLP